MLIAYAINEIHRSLCVCSINCDIGEIWSVHFENVVRNAGIRENIRDSPLTGNGWMELCIIASRLQEASMNCRDARTILIQVLLKNETLWSFFLKSNFGQVLMVIFISSMDWGCLREKLEECKNDMEEDKPLF